MITPSLTKSSVPLLPLLLIVFPYGEMTTVLEVKISMEKGYTHILKFPYIDDFQSEKSAKRFCFFVVFFFVHG